MLKKIVLGVIIVILVIGGVAVWFGAFNPVKIKKTVTGPYEIACLDNIGPYKNIGKKIEGAAILLAEQKIKSEAACGVYYDDPRVVPTEKLRSKGGFIVKADTKLKILEELKIPKREVVVAKLKANPALAAMKTYPAIEKWAKKNNYKLKSPSFEIYHDNGVVEVQMPITKKEPVKEKEKEKEKK